ncbi:collagen-binding domain-containing protein [Levilactobacillus zymae]|uniref:collagen-binding domain-containing protein n=1 Tax=Levilactobacillus zymae TaxID=267363 RepID=UPI0028B4CE41|nr:collagen-binding domain-containing protein [Levilactobacillus zymae]MDT6979819.1 KxYKxGKxW signal peptide domain-containing protein [Levilactobacillus zymae]
METKQTHFKMYKDGRKWVFACAVVLALGGSATVAHADNNANAVSNSSSSVVTNQSGTSSADTKSDSTSQSSSSAGQDTTDHSSTTQTSGAATTTTQRTSGISAYSASATDPAADESNSTSSSSTSTATATSQSSQTTTKDNTAKVAQQLKANHQKALQFAQALKRVAAKTPKAAAAVEPLADSGIQAGGSVYDDYPTIEEDNLLGVSSAFHIFARDAELNAHTNGNVAVQNLTGNVNFGTNIIEELLDKDISYIQNFNNIASSSFVSAGSTRENKVVFGEGVNIDISNPNRPSVNGTYIDHLLAAEVYQDQVGQTYIDFDQEFEKLRAKNAKFAAMTSVKDYTAADFPDRNNRVIDVTDMTPDENGRIVINLSPDVLQGDTPLTIKGLSPDADGDTIIINVDTGSDPDYHINSQIKVVYSDGTDRNNQETEDFGDNHLLWNFIDRSAADQQYTGTIHVDRPFQGSVLAPSATVEANQNLDGNIIADKVIVNAETHRWDLQDNQKPDVDENGGGDENEFEIAVTLPGIGVELPKPEEPEPEVPEPETPEPETPGTENPEPETPGVEEPDVEEENSYGHHHADDEVVDEFEDEFAADVTEAEQEATLTKLETAIAKAKATGDTTLVARLEAVEQQLLTAMGRSTGVGTGLPQTGEAHHSVAQLLGLALAGSLLGSWLLRRKRQD